MSTDQIEFLKNQGAEFEGSTLVSFSAQPESRHSNTISILSNQAFIEITGPDTQKFLQGQISVHMDHLEAGQHRPGVACTPKGRMYTSFRILNKADGYLLSTNKDVAEHTLTTLGKYSVFFKSELTLTDNFIGLGIAGSKIESALTESGLTLPHEGKAQTVDGGYLLKTTGLCPRFELWINPEALSGWWHKLTPFCTPATAAQWQLLNIEAVITGLNSDTIEKYIPQHLNMPALGGVSFKKGCYTGQEIVTRMQSLGQQKSRSYRLLIDGHHEIKNGDRLFDQHSKAIGEVLESVFADDSQQTEILAVIRINTAETGVAYLDEALTQTVAIQPLPYPVDSKAELQQ